MLKNGIIIFVGLITVGYITLALDRVSYGNLYIVNKTDWPLKIIADIKDEWDVKTPTSWDVEVDGTEKTDNLFKLQDITFNAIVDDESKVNAWVYKKYPLNLGQYQPATDLFVTISKDPYLNRWNIKYTYSAATKVEPGGPTGYTPEKIAR